MHSEALQHEQPDVSRVEHERHVEVITHSYRGDKPIAASVVITSILRGACSLFLYLFQLKGRALRPAESPLHCHLFVEHLAEARWGVQILKHLRLLEVAVHLKLMERLPIQRMVDVANDFLRLLR